MTISEWFDKGKEQGHSHMLIVCDTFDYEDYPVYVGIDENVEKIYNQYNGPNMQRVMEVYKLSDDKEVQLNIQRACNF